MGEESYLSKKVKEKIKSFEHRGREYYRVVPKPDTSAQKEMASKWNYEDVYLGDNYNPKHSPQGHPKKIPEQHAERRSKLGQMQVEVHWFIGQVEYMEKLKLFNLIKILGYSIKRVKMA